MYNQNKPIALFSLAKKKIIPLTFNNKTSNKTSRRKQKKELSKQVHNKGSHPALDNEVCLVCVADALRFGDVSCLLVNEVNGQGASAPKRNPNDEQETMETNDLVVGVYIFFPFSSQGHISDSM